MDKPNKDVREKRKYMRVNTQKFASMQINVKRDNKTINTISMDDIKVRNLSGGGMYLELPLLESSILERLLSGKDKLFLRISLPVLATPVNISANMVWLETVKATRKQFVGAGISFDNITEKTREELVHYILTLLLK